MRIVKEVVHPQMKINVFSWNGKYLLKFEQGDLEQTYKIDELDLTLESELDEVMNESFISEVLSRFREMSDSLHKSLSNI